MPEKIPLDNWAGTLGCRAGHVVCTYGNVSGIAQAGTVKMPPGGWVGRGFLAPDPSLTIMYYVYVRSQLSSYLVKLHIQGAYQTMYLLTSIYKHIHNMPHITR